ncbi:MAG: type II toxin-antitoxin system YafQ family toxin [Patescibacteria group bacterium]
MYSILYSSKFRKQSKKIVGSGKYPREKIEYIINILASGIPLEPHLKNHKLHGKYNGMMECHVIPNMLLVYEKDEEKRLIILMALGSHSELFK